jgi:hypothetical protein
MSVSRRETVQNRFNTLYAPIDSAGNSNFPSGVVISDGTSNANLLNVAQAFWGNYTLQTATTSNQQATLPFTASQLNAWIKPGDPTTQKSGNYTATGIDYQGNAGSGTGATFLTVNDSLIASGNPFALTGISTINGAVPGVGGGIPKIQYGIFGLSNTGQTITYPEAFNTNPSVFITPSGLDGIGFFGVGNSNTTDFQVSYSGELVSIPVDVNWLAIGT